jgi:hypothetical protein
LLSIKFEEKKEKKNIEEDEEYEIMDIYMYGKSLFDLKEYKRTNKFLSELNIKENSKYFLKMKFLELYSLYLSGERIKEQEINENKENKERISNKEIKRIFYELKELKKCDCYLNYLFGLILKEINKKNDAIDFFIKSINENEYFWGSWIEIFNLFKDKDMVISI